MRLSLTLILSIFVASLLPAEVVFLRSGEILFGDIVAAGAGTVTIRMFGNPREIPSKDILRTEPGLAEIKDITFQVLLKDGTSIKGKLTDFDEEIGLFVDIGFGTLALPTTAVDKIVDPSLTSNYGGSPFLLGIQGAAVFPLTANYGIGFEVVASGEFQLLGSRELYALISFSWLNPNYVGDTGVSLHNLSASIGVMYKMASFGEIFPSLEIITPFAALSGGATLVTLFDERDEALVDQRGLLTSSLALQAGLDWKILPNLSLRTDGGADFVFQTSGVFIAPKAGASLVMGF